MYEIRYHSDVVAGDLRRVDPPVRQRILNQIQKRLTTAPAEYGKPLRYSLKGYWRLRVGDYRVVYETDPKNRIVTVWLVDQRKDDRVYIEFLKRLEVGLK